jgi:hypothetical protein
VRAVRLSCAKATLSSFLQRRECKPCTSLAVDSRPSKPNGRVQ